MRIDIISIFPDYLAPLELSLIGKARAAGRLELHTWDLRAFTTDLHRTVDDTPYGGGPGMIMKAPPWGSAIDAVLEATDSDPLLVFPMASGHTFTQRTAEAWSGEEHLVFACGRYEGIDDRVMVHYSQSNRVATARVGDYVLAGGEAATLVMVEAIGRLVPGVLGNAASVVDDSFAKERDEVQLEGPSFTKPRQWRGLAVPEVLLSGDHAKIAEWREEASRSRTRERN
ncbi:MAG: tRNA (guanosine(37)-N1)-methyltransferase TrmD [Actinomycetia bacterium]|nr:tRNA (guanosine(37)-N1)-methyltransferase TrmD [Actinomycetes bacterium]